MLLAVKILRYELSVWMRNGCTENHFHLGSVKNKSKISTNKKNYINEDYHCAESPRIRNYSDPHFPAFRLNTDQNNSEYGHLLRSLPFGVSFQF